MTKKVKPLTPIDLPQQPEACKGCLWGKWVGVSQVCSLPRCVPNQLKPVKSKTSRKRTG